MELRFRKWISFLGIISLGMVLYFASPLFAQEGNQEDGDGPIVVRTYNIRKIYAHRLGYRIDVMDYRGRIRTIYAKLTWFSDPEISNPESDQFEVAAEMEFVTPSRLNGSNYLTLAYQGGQLRNMSVYVDEPRYSAKNYANIWWAVDPNESVDSKFDITTVQFTDPPEIPAGEIPQAPDDEDNGEGQ